ncbi:DUF2513 domain-containing protein [Pseudovibrio sp. SPO723]|uniref:DUF2513 domain-containing protein n=1 Tax=Nesiotobacter zosterae TaxID=392721 RepID=UPI0029C4124B|nr:DUF2513 domain-containing protein [Pseudovibrio sp. SPO723]MDX5595326.1 DUF2513 domain-containing protein [Pseudovibrio sp. SPO723]
MSEFKMDRDMDYVRDLLLQMKDGKRTFVARSDEVGDVLGLEPIGMNNEEANKLEYHLNLLDKAAFIEIGSKPGDGTYIIDSITWDGHDFLDSVQDDEIWEKTKEGAKKVGGFTVDLLVGIAKSYLEAKAKTHLGL